MPTITSPCVRNCCLNEEDICLGCFRSLAEIVTWRQANDDERRLILAATEKRRCQYTKISTDKLNIRAKQGS